LEFGRTHQIADGGAVQVIPDREYYERMTARSLHYAPTMNRGLTKKGRRGDVTGNLLRELQEEGGRGTLDSRGTSRQRTYSKKYYHQFDCQEDKEGPKKVVMESLLGLSGQAPFASRPRSSADSGRIGKAEGKSQGRNLFESLEEMRFLRREGRFEKGGFNLAIPCCGLT